jgi:hypothetical protein
MIPTKIEGGKPVIYSVNPIIFSIKYKVPDSLNNKLCYLRINSYQRGKDPFYILRKDEINVEDLYKDYQTTYFNALLKSNDDFNRNSN